MANKVHITDEDRKAAADVFSAYTGELDEDQYIDPGTIPVTDDMSECQPFIDLVKQLTGESTTDIADLPFDKYTPFDQTRLDHQFRITTVHKDLTAIVPEVDRFKEFYRIAEQFTNESSLIVSAAMDSNIKDITCMPPSYVFSYAAKKIREVITMLQKENIPGLSDLKDYAGRFDRLASDAKHMQAPYPDTSTPAFDPDDYAIRIVADSVTFPLVPRLNETEPTGDFGFMTPERPSHRGLDLKVYTEQAVSNTGKIYYTSSHPVVAIAEGKVIHCTSSNNLAKPCVRFDTDTNHGEDVDGKIFEGRDGGNIVIIWHPDLGKMSAYMHLSEISVKKGNSVLAGDVIGVAGNTGGSTGPHLHFEMRDPSLAKGAAADISSWRKGVPINPWPYIGGGYNGDPTNSEPAIKLEATQGNLKAEDTVEDFREYLNSLTMSPAENPEDQSNVLYAIHRQIMARVTSSVHSVYVNDISGKAEQVTINWMPGTSKAIPIEGQSAPVIQSLGGRNVQVSISLKGISPVEVAKIALMFKVPSTDETIAGMLTLARSGMFGETSIRNSYLQRWYRTDQIESMLRGISGSTQKVHLDEPVIVDNEYLNSMGLKTFHPISMEVKTVPQASEAYDILLTLSYMNLRNRSLESLKKSRHGIQAPVLPVTARVFPEKATGDSGFGLESDYQAYGILSRLSIVNCLAEILPLYIMSRVYRLYKTMSEYTPGSVIDLDGLDIMTKILAPTGIDTAIEKVFSTVRDYDTDVPSFSSAILDASMELANLGTVAALSRYTEKTIEVAKQGTGSNKFSKIVAATLGAVTTLNSVLKYAFGPVGTPEVNRGAETRTLYMNIPSLAPIMIWSLLAEFIDRLSAGKENEFFSEISNDVIDMLNDSYAEPNVRTLRIGGSDEVFVEVKGAIGQEAAGGEYKPLFIGEIKLSMIMGGEHDDSERNTLFGSIDVSEGLGQIWFGSEDAKALRKKLVDEIETMARNPRGNYDTRFLYPAAYGAVEINWLAIDAIRAAALAIGPMLANDNMKPGGDIPDGHMSEFFQTAAELLRDESARNHCSDVLTSVLTYSMADVLANGMIATHGRKAAYAHNDSVLRAFNKMSSLETEDTVVTALQYLGSRIQSHIVKARRVTQSRDMCTQVVSGVFADRSFGGSKDLRKGYCCALGSVLNYMYQVAYAGTETVSSLPPEYNDYTIPAMLQIIDRDRGELMIDELLHRGKSFFAATVGFLPDIIIGAAIALSGPGAVLTTIFYIIRGAMDIWAVWDLVMSIFKENAIEFAFGRGNIFAMSRWCSGRISDAMDQSQLLECCIKSGIWMPAALKPRGDTFDEERTSYRDFPTVHRGGKPLPPDFFVYKVGILSKAYDDMKSYINSAVESTRDRYADLDNDNVEALKTELKQEIDESRELSRARVQDALTRALIDSTPEDKSLKKDYMQAVGKSGDIISYVVYGNRTDAAKKGHICSTKYGSYSSTVSKAGSMLHLDMSDVGVVVKIGSSFTPISKGPELSELITNKGELMQMIVEAANSSPYGKVRENLKSFLQRSIREILDYIAATKALGGQFVYGLDTMPGTIGNLILIKNIVGSNIRAIGKPGLALFKSQMDKVGRDSLRRSSTLQTQYIFPTVKLYFIEEDSENFYLFDDLYSYASIVEVSVHMDKYSPVRTSEIKITNLFGMLNDILSDSKNKEYNFFSGPDENAPLNSVMLRPGCKIKIQAGTTPILDEHDTIFTGRISTIDFNVITTITAVSAGDMFTESLSMDVVKVYGSQANATGGLGTKLIQAPIREGIQSMVGDDYMAPITKLKTVIGYVLYDVVQSTERLTDFSLRPPVEVQDPEISPATSNLMDILKKKLIITQSSSFIESVSGARVDLQENQQLFENIYLDTDVIGSSWFGNLTFIGEGVWVSRDESAWDIMSELNLLLPNHDVLVRPYDTRSTLVWNNDDGYYRFRRCVDLDNILTNALTTKLRIAGRDPRFKLLPLFDVINQGMNGGSPRRKAAAIALLTQLAYISQRIYGSFMLTAPTEYRAEIPDDKLILMSPDISNEEMIPKALDWLSPELIKNTGSVSVDIAEILENIADENEEEDEFIQNGVSNLKLEDVSISPDSSPIPSYIKKDEAKTAYLLSLNLAADSTMNFMRELAFTRSKNHRKVSDMHIKVSGRDIIKNDITLMEPYNTVRMSYPKEDLSDDELSAAALLGVSGEGNEIMVPIHYKLKPWGRKIYQTHFKNANVLPTARTSAISTATTSVLANLMKETYGGTITLLGDSRIMEGDRIFLWDENRDLYGVVGVKSHTFIMSPESGCMSVIEPEMITRNDGKLKRNLYDTTVTTLNIITKTLGTLVLIGGSYLLFRYARSRYRMSSALLDVTEQSGFWVRLLTGIGRSLRNLRDNLPLAKLIGRGFTSWFHTLDNGKLAKGLYRSYMKTSSTLREIFDPNFVTDTTTALRTWARGVSETYKDLPLVGSIIGSKLTDRNLNRVIEKAVDTAMDSLVTLKSSKMAASIDIPTGESFRRIVKDNVIKELDNYLLTLPTPVIIPDNRLLRSGLETAVSTVIDSRIKISKGTAVSMVEDFDSTLRNLVKEMEVGENTVREYVRNLNPSQYPSGILGRGLHLRTAKEKDFIVKATEGMITETRRMCISDSKSLLSMVKRYGGMLTKVAIGGSIAYEAFSAAASAIELYMFIRETADKIVLSPLMFRGEPFMAGLEGVTKQDGEQAGFAGIMVSRFTDVVEAFGDRLSSPVLSALVELEKMKRGTVRDIGGGNRPGPVVERD